MVEPALAMFVLAAIVGLRGGGAYLATNGDNAGDGSDRWTHEAKLLWAVPPLLVAGLMFLIVG